MRILFVLFATLICVFAAEKTSPKPKQSAAVSFVADVVPQKALGYFTVHEKTVDIYSLGGTIHLTLPRVYPGRWQSMTKAEQEAELKSDRERIWPLDSPEFTSEFRDWIGRVERVSDAGVLPEK